MDSWSLFHVCLPNRPLDTVQVGLRRTAAFLRGYRGLDAREFRCSYRHLGQVGHEYGILEVRR